MYICTCVYEWSLVVMVTYVGHPNVGKSSILNGVMGKKVEFIFNQRNL